MEDTGIQRKCDALGRFVLPKEMRRTLGMNVRDAIEITVENDKIILKKYIPTEDNDFTTTMTYKQAKALVQQVESLQKMKETYDKMKTSQH